jgi:hypothetical protein
VRQLSSAMRRRAKRTKQDSLSTVDVLSLRLTNARKRKDLLKQLNVQDLLGVLKDALEQEEGVSIEDLVSGILDSLPSTVCLTCYVIWLFIRYEGVLLFFCSGSR